MKEIDFLLQTARFADIDSLTRFQKHFDTTMGFGVECYKKVLTKNGEGLRIKHPDHPEIYFIDGGECRLIPSDQTHSNLFFDFQHIYEIPNIE